MQNAIAFANNDVITVAWSFGQKLEGCMGFAVYRIDANGKETALPAGGGVPRLQAGGHRHLREVPHPEVLLEGRLRPSRCGEDRRARLPLQDRALDG
jgi:hypothetical protein